MRPRDVTGRGSIPASSAFPRVPADCQHSTPVIEPCGKEDKHDIRTWRTGVHSRVPGLDPTISQSPADSQGNHNEIAENHQVRARI
jgi:hypothetical protein